MAITCTIYDKDGNIKLGKNDYEEKSKKLTATDERFLCIATQDCQYEAGDVIEVECDQAGEYLMVQLDKTLAPSLIFVKGKKWRYPVPLSENWQESLPEYTFKGKRHVLTVRKAKPFEVEQYQNLTFNAHDLKEETGAYPHADANVETRNDSTFFAKNAIDGVYANESHGSYPYQSWGINQQPDAALTIDFGREVLIDCVELTLRADFPHDSYWTEATVEFSDGSQEIFSLEKTDKPQSFSFDKRLTNQLVLMSLNKAPDESPFPALTQLAAYGWNKLDESKER